MTPRPTHPDAIKPMRGGIHQRFVKSRFGWSVHTTHNCFIIEAVPFAFTREGIERKAQRIVRSLTREPTDEFTRRYDARGHEPPRPAPEPPVGLGHREQTPR